MLVMGLYLDHSMAPTLLRVLPVAAWLSASQSCYYTSAHQRAGRSKWHLLLCKGNRSLSGPDMCRLLYFSLPRRKTTTTKILTYFSNYNGSPVVMGECAFGHDNRWTFQDGTITMYNGTKCLDVTDGEDSNGVKVQIWDCVPGNVNQQWSYVGNFHLTWADSDRCLDVTNGNRTNGNRVQIWDCSKCVEEFKAQDNQSTSLFITSLL